MGPPALSCPHHEVRFAPAECKRRLLRLIAEAPPASRVSRSLREGASEASAATSTTRALRVVRGFAGALGARRERVAGRWSRAGARRTRVREPSPRRAQDRARRREERAGKSPGNSANVSRSGRRPPPEGQRAPLAGRCGRSPRTWPLALVMKCRIRCSAARLPPSLAQVRKPGAYRRRGRQGPLQCFAGSAATEDERRIPCSR